MSPRALITGAAGFVGAHLAPFLTEQGIQIFGMDRADVPSPGDWPGQWHSADVTNAAEVAAVARDVEPDYVFHLAALIKSDSIEDLLAVNVVGTQTLLDALVQGCPTARVLVTGSAAEYGMVQSEELPIGEDNPLRPLSPYGISKVAQSLLAAQYCHRRQLHVIRARTFNLTGPAEPDSLVCSAFAHQIAEIEKDMRPPVMKVGNLDSARDFVDVRDAVGGYWSALKAGSAGDVFNVCSGRAVRIENILNMLLDLSTARIEVQTDSRRFTAWDIPEHYGDPSRLRDATGWSPVTSLQRSLTELLDWWRNRIANTARQNSVDR